MQVVSIKAYCRSSGEVVQISYQKCVCVLEGTRLLNVLKSQKRYYQPNDGTIGASKKIKVDVVVVPCKKFEYEYGSSSNGRPSVNDSTLVEPHASNYYDYLAELCYSHGNSAKAKNEQSKSSLVLSAGIKPYVGFNYVTDGYIPAELSEVAKDVAGKFSSSLANWFFKSKEPEKKLLEEEHKEEGEKMNCRFGLCDLEREAWNVWVCPYSKIAAVSDNLQRIILVDCKKGLAFKMLKGYRDAQCAFLKVRKDPKDKSDSTKAMFLVAYAPKRSCLEIWLMQNGPRVAAFNVSKYGQLIYNTHTLMGIPSDVYAKYKTTYCFFLDPSDSFVKEIKIPFHCALNETESKAAKDIHYLKKLKSLLRNLSYDKDSLAKEFKAICSSIESLEIKNSCFDYLKEANQKLSPALFHVAVDSLKDSTKSDTSFYKILRHYCILAEFYLAEVLKSDSPEPNLDILSENEVEVNELGLDLRVLDTEPDKSPDIKSEDDGIKFAESDMKPLDDLLSLILKENGEGEKIDFNSSKVSFSNDSATTDLEENEKFFQFLNSFEITTDNVSLKVDNVKDLKEIGERIYSKYIMADDIHCLSIFIKNARKSEMFAEDLMWMLLYYWSEIDFRFFDR